MPCGCLRPESVLLPALSHGAREGAIGALGAAALDAQDAAMRLVAGLLVLIFACGAPAAGAADDVTIYRCTDTSGRLTLRDTPCRKGQTQQTRTMLRPRERPMSPAPAPLPRRDRADLPPPRAVVVLAPRPLYECIPPEGAPYTSDSGEGRPRWVPLWTLGYRVPTAGYAGTASNTGLGITHGGVHNEGRYGLAAYGAGTWIRDDCRALPQDEVCARLVGRRDEIRRRFFNAMPSERDVLRVEERGVNARLYNDCASY